MNDVRAIIIVIPDLQSDGNESPNGVTEFWENLSKEPGLERPMVSTPDKINVMKERNSGIYVVAFKASDIMCADDDKLESIVRSTVNIFVSNIPGSYIHFSMPVHDYQLSNVLNITAMVDMHNMFANVDQVKLDDATWRYGESVGIQKLYDKISELHTNSEFVRDERIQESKVDQIDTENEIQKTMRMFGIDDIDYDGGYHHKKRKSKKKKKKRSDIAYGMSKVIKAAPNPKKAYRRHGLIVCSRKSAIQKDESVIKDFLKDFIPGSSHWKKSFRKDLLKRWMRVYVITKKDLNRLEKNQRKAIQRDRTNANIERTINYTRQLFAPVDRWNDPNR